MSKPFERKLSPSERLWIAIDQACPTFGAELCVTGEGELDLDRFRTAVTEASAANPGTRVQLRGHLGWSRWRDSGRTPPIAVVDGAGWDARSPQGMPAFEQVLEARQGPTADVVVIRGDPLRLLFRSLHSTMDGMGVLTWMDDIFRSLRGESLIGSTSTISDIEMARQLKSEGPSAGLDPVCYPPTGRAPGTSSSWRTGFDWRRVSIPGHVSNLLSRTVRILATSAWEKGQDDGGGPGIVRISVPVDMRRHHAGLRTTSNLTSCVVIHVEPETTADQIRPEIHSQIEERRDLDMVRLVAGVENIPLSAMRYVIRKDMKKCHREGRYATTATVSTLGRLDLAAFEFPGFKPREIFPMPPSGGVEGCPLTVALSGTEKEIQILVMVPYALAGDGRIDAMAELLLEELRG